MTSRAHARRLVFAFAAAVLAAATGWSVAQDSAPAGPVALLAAIEGPIGPATVHHMENVVELARERDAEILVLRLDTLGGLAASRREIIKVIFASSVLPSWSSSVPIAPLGRSIPSLIGLPRHPVDGPAPVA